jgi:hypothetical protein
VVAQAVNNAVSVTHKNQKSFFLSVDTKILK